MNTLKRSMLLVLVLVLSLPITTVGATDTIDFTITLTSPNVDPIYVGNEVDIDLVFSAANVSQGITGGEVYLSYDPNYFKPLSSDPNVTVASRSGFFDQFAAFLPSLVLKDPGLPSDCQDNPCIYLMAAGPVQKTRTGAVARFRFLATSVGTAAFSVVGSTILNADGVAVDIDNKPVTKNMTISDLPTPALATAKGTVQRQGTPPTLECTRVMLVGITPPIPTDSDGEFTLISQSGVYTLKAEYPGYLSSQKSITVNAESQPDINLGETRLRGGDVNGNGTINMVDIQMIIDNFGKWAGVRSSPNCGDDSPYLSLDPMDINDDHKINISDLAIAAGNYSLTTAETTWPEP